MCIFIPILLILLFDKFLTPLLQDFMSSVRIGEGNVLNSSYTRNNVIAPFCESLVIIGGIITSYALFKFLQKVLLKREIYFVRAKECLKYLEIATILLGVIIAVYGKVDSFDYSQYGYSINTVKEVANQEDSIQYIPLEKIPSIHSIGIETTKGAFLYNILLHISQFMLYLSDNFEMVIAIAGAVIIPFKSYSEKLESIESICDTVKKRAKS